MIIYDLATNVCEGAHEMTMVSTTREMILDGSLDAIEFRGQLHDGHLRVEGLLADQAIKPETVSAHGLRRGRSPWALGRLGLS